MTHVEKVYKDNAERAQTIYFLKNFLPDHVGEVFSLSELCKLAGGTVSVSRMRAWLTGIYRDWQVSLIPAWKTFSIVDDNGIVVGNMKRKYYNYKIEKVRAN